MSDNPFDVFAADFKAAIPATQSEDERTNGPPAPINIMPPQTEAPVPVMNTPAMNPPPQQPPQQQQQPMQGGMGMGMNGMQGGMSSGGGYAMGMNPPMMGGGMYGAPPQQQPPAMGNTMNQPPAMNTMNQPPLNTMNQQQQPRMGGGAMVPSATQSNPYMMSPPPAQKQQFNTYGAPPPAGPGDAFGAPPPGPDTFGAPPPGPDAFGAPPAPVPPSPVPPVAAPEPFVPAPPAAVNYSPYGAPPADQAPPAMPLQSNDPWGTPAAPLPPSNAVVPAPTPSNDPFGVFGGNAGPPAGPPAYDPNDVLSVATPANPNQLTQEQVLNAVDGGLDPWATGSTTGPPAPTSDSGFGIPLSTSNDGGGGLLGDGISPVPEGPGGAEGELPPGGEWYDARIFTPTLGVMFFKPQELTDSLFLQTDKSLVTALDDRPVVAFIVEGSSARAAGVELGHVLLKVNGIDVKNPKEASRLIKEGPRPLPLLFYVPDTTVVVAEGEHMVKYDTRETGAPNSAKDWKPKYVVIGGIIAQPWMMNMYRSKSEYDIAVIETQARRPVSVKVKQFSLQGARVQNDWQGPQMVKYKNKLHPWKYIVILPVSRNPIKISSPNLGQLKPVHEGIRRVLMAQQRHHQQQQVQQQQPSQQPHMGGGGYGGPPPQQHHQQQQQHYGGPPPPQQQQHYGGPPPQQQQQHYGQPEQAVVPHPQGNANPYGGYPGQPQQQPQGAYDVQGGVGSVRRGYQY